MKISQLVQKIRMTSKGYMLVKFNADVTVIVEFHLLLKMDQIPLFTNTKLHICNCPN